MTTVKLPGRFRRFLDRAVLGTLMGILVWIVERRLVKAVRRRGQAAAADPGAAELAAPPQEVHHQAQG